MPTPSELARDYGLTDMLLLPGGEAASHAAHSAPLSEPSMWAGIPDELDHHIYHWNDNRGRNYNRNTFMRLYLAYWRIDDRYPYPTLAEMAQVTKRTERTIKQYLQELLDAGLIEHVERQWCNGEREMIYSLDGITRLCQEQVSTCRRCVDWLAGTKRFHAQQATDAGTVLRPRFVRSSRGTKSPHRKHRRR
jgi:hypothetical protein